MFTESQLADLLQCDTAYIRRLVKEGMPCVQSGRTRKYDGDSVHAWLVANGRVQQPDKSSEIVGTVQEVATALGVGPRTVASWCSQGMPYTTPGPGKRGCYDLREIREWRANHFGDESTSTKLRNELMLARIQSHQLKNQKLASGVIDRATARETVARIYQFTRSVLEKIPVRIAKHLPASVTNEERKQLRSKLESEIQSIFEELESGGRELGAITTKADR